MKDFLPTIAKASIFKGISDDEISSLIACLGARNGAYKKGQFILRTGDTPDSVGLLLTGSALIIQDDFWGNRNILARVNPSTLFAEAFACSPGTIMNVDVTAEDTCSVMWLKVSRILSTCPTACSYHSRMMRNLLSELAVKNLQFNERMMHMGQRTTREKVLSYLSVQSQKQGKKEFDIVFNRQQLADYLSVERSALSAELSKLRNGGYIEFERNHFVLK